MAPHLSCRFLVFARFREAADPKAHKTISLAREKFKFNNHYVDLFFTINQIL